MQSNVTNFATVVRRWIVINATDVIDFWVVH